MVGGSMSEVPNPEIRTRLEYQGFTDGVYQFPSLRIQAIVWCTAHSSTGQGPSRRGVVCHYSALRQATKRGLDILEPCEFSIGGAKHKWWRDL